MNIPFATINNHTLQIKVSPNFYLLKEDMQDFITRQLKNMVKQGGNIIAADQQTLQEMSRLYPNIRIWYWVKELAIILRNECPNEFNLNRIISLIKYCEDMDK